MKRLVTLSIILMAAAASAFAQKTQDEKDALALVERLFAAMRAANAADILATGTKDNQLVAVQTMRDGKKRIDVINGEQFTKFFTTPNSIKEVMYDPKVEVSGDWAMVWGRYVLFVGDKISHCGINQFNMVRMDGVWKIANGASTIDPNACTAKEKKMKP